MPEPDELHRGTPGASARRRQQRLEAALRDERANASFLKRLCVALLGPSQRERRATARERAWNTGAAGEEWLGVYLARRCPTVTVLHDRRRPGTKANIDHIAIAPSGVYVIDAKRIRGSVEVRRPLFGPATLRINGRDRTNLVAGLEKQRQAVTSTLGARDPDVPVYACLCFVAPAGLLADSGLPVLRTLSINGYPLHTPRRLAKLLNQPGPLDTARVADITTALAARFPPAAGRSACIR